MSTANNVLAVLRNANIKFTEEGNNQYRMHSPLRSGSDSHAFTLTIDDDEHGAWKDHASGESGSLYDLAQKLGIETPQKLRKEVSSSKRGYENLADYALSHGATLEDFQQAGWRDEIVQGRKALVIPTESGERVRFIDGQENAVTYRAMHSGYKTCFYGLKRALDMARTANLDLILCNGEASTVVAQVHTIAAFSTTGGEKALSEELLKQLQSTIESLRASNWRGRFGIALDCDDTGRKAAQEIMTQMRDYMPYVIDLGLGDKGDLADFCYLNGEQADDTIKKLFPLKPSIGRTVDYTEMHHATTELTKALKADNREDAEKLVGKAQAAIDKVKDQVAITSIGSSTDAMKEASLYFGEILALEGKLPGFTTGIRDLDVLLGGVNPFVYTFLAATGAGKSTLSASLAAILSTQANGLVVPTENSQMIWYMKVASYLANIPLSDILYGRIRQNTPEASAYRAALWKIKEQDAIQFLNEAAPTIDQLDIAIRRTIAEKNVKWVIVDSFSNLKGRGDGIYAETSSKAEAVRELCMKYNVPIIQTVQIGRNKKGMTNKMPSLNDGKGAGDIEEYSHWVGGLYNHDQYVRLGEAEPSADLPRGTVLINCLKQNFGDQVGNTIKTYFNGAGFYQMERDQKGIAS